MAGGLMGFLGFGKRAKTSLTPVNETAKFEDLPFTKSLSDLASSRLRGEGLGYGPDFVDKAANPAIAKLESQFKNKTMPNLSSQASARGLGRSSLVMNQIGEAEGEKNRDVSDLVSKFFVLNKAQEKQDTTEAIGLGQNLNNQAQNVSTQRANEARDLRDKQLGVDNNNNARADAMQSQTLQALGGATSGFFGSSAGQGLLKRIGLEGAAPTQAQMVAKQSLLGSSSGLTLEDLMKLKSAGLLH